MDYYSILGVDKNASEQDIKKAYRKLAQQHHPDKEGGDEKKFKEVSEAYEVLSDKQKRAQFDQFGSVGGGAGGFNGFQGFDFGNMNNVHFDFGGFGDIFDNFFGGGQTRSQKKSGPTRGNDIEMMAHVSFEESVFGATKEVEYGRYEPCSKCNGTMVEPGSKMKTCETCSGTGQHVRVQRTPLGNIQTAATCSTCQGAGQIPEKKCSACEGEGRVVKNTILKVRIPSGIYDGAVIRLKEKGEAGVRNGGYGDLFIHIKVAPSKEYERDGNDLYSTETIRVPQAVLGAEIMVKTVHGKVALKIPAGTEHGKQFKIKGYGIPDESRGSKGDHIVTVKVEIPKKLSRKEKELYESLEELNK